MIFRESNNLNLLLISSAYLDFISVSPLLSNPNRAGVEPYRLGVEAFYLTFSGSGYGVL